MIYQHVNAACMISKGTQRHSSAKQIELPHDLLTLKPSEIHIYYWKSWTLFSTVMKFERGRTFTKLKLCSPERWYTYVSQMDWGWVNHGVILILCWSMASTKKPWCTKNENTTTITLPPRFNTKNVLGTNGNKD